MQPRTVEELGNGVLEVWDLDTSEAFLNTLLIDLFENHWHEIVFGTLIQGLSLKSKLTVLLEKIGVLDGYLTVDFGSWHFHICTGHNSGTSRNPTSPELAQIRKTTRAELYRRLNPDGTVGSWGLRLFNGRDENQLTIFLPTPFLSNEMKFLKQPDWKRLTLWDKLRKTYLGLEADAKDRFGKTMFHG